MGLGKTIQTIALVKANAMPATVFNRNTIVNNRIISRASLIVCTASTIMQWKNEIIAKLGIPASSILVYHGSSRKADITAITTRPFVLTTYGILKAEYKAYDSQHTTDVQSLLHMSAKELRKRPKDLLFCFKWWRVVLDEAHEIRNKETKIHSAVSSLLTHKRWCLTGTPIQNSVMDIYALLNFLKHPSFNDRRIINAVLADLKSKDGAIQSAAFDRLRDMIQPLMLRRTKSVLSADQTAFELPECSIETVSVVLNDKERVFYDLLSKRMAEEFNSYAAEGTILSHYMQVLVLLLRLRQACNHPYLLFERSFWRSVIGKDEEGHFIYYGKMNRKLHILYHSQLEVASTICSTTVPNAITLADQQAPIDVDKLDEVPDDDEFAIAEAITAIDGLVEENNLKDSQSRRESLVSLHLNRRDSLLSSPLKQARSRSSLAGSPLTSTSSRFRCQQLQFQDLPIEIIQIICSMLCDDDPRAFCTLALVSKQFQSIIDTMFDGLKSSSKLDALVMKLEQIYSNARKKEKCVIFSQFCTFLDVLECRFGTNTYSCLRLDGTMPVADRNRVLQEFENDDNQQLLLVSLMAGACGINMNMASHVFIMDPWWNPAIEQQAIDRVHRFGQKSAVQVYRFIVQNSVEERLLKVQDRKKRMMNELMTNQGADGSSKLSVDDIRDLLS